MQQKGHLLLQGLAAPAHLLETWGQTGSSTAIGGQGESDDTHALLSLARMFPSRKDGWLGRQALPLEPISDSIARRSIDIIPPTHSAANSFVVRPSHRRPEATCTVVSRYRIK